MIDRIVAVCPSIERQDLLKALVRSYRETIAEPPPLTVVSMGPDDGTWGWAANQGLHVVREPAVLPYAKAMNRGVAAALEQHPTAEWLLLLNDDLILQPGFWEALQEMAGFGYEMCAATLLYPLDYQAPAGTPPVDEGVHRIQHYGKVFTLDFRPFHILRYQPETHPQAQQPRPFPDVTFACVAIKRQVWEGVGGLDEGYTNGYEDDAFCLTAREGGAQIGVHPKMRAIHREAQTTGKDTDNKAAQYARFHTIWVDSGRIVWPLGMFQGWAS